MSWVEAIGPGKLGTCKTYLGICQGKASLFWGVSLTVKPGGAGKGPSAHANHNSVHSQAAPMYQAECCRISFHPSNNQTQLGIILPLYTDEKTKLSDTTNK